MRQVAANRGVHIILLDGPNSPMQCALEAAGVELTNGDEPGVKLRKPR